MKTAVITFHSAHNYGATLQTWALQKALKKLGTDPCVIHYHPQVIDRLYEVPKLDTVKKRGQYLFHKSVRERHKQLKLKYSKYNAFIKSHLELAGDYTTYDELLANPPKADCYIAGSDQIWNPDHTDGADPAYLLRFLPENVCRVAYAASIGRERFPAQYEAEYTEGIRSFSAVSVREVTAKTAVEKAFGREVPVVLDPTMLLTKAEYEEIKVPTKRKEKYILVYMMENNRELISLANRISVVTGFPIIQRKPGRIFHSELPSFFTDTPGEFLGELEKAEYVITNSFHGTVFSMIYEKPFVSMLHTETGSRISDLLKSVGMEEHLIRPKRKFRSMEQFAIKDALALRRRIAELRRESICFLKEALQIGGNGVGEG